MAVSKDNLRKVEEFFVEQARQKGTNIVQATVAEIADGSGVALATAHKALKELKKLELLNWKEPKSRRFPIEYKYIGSIEGFQQNINKDDQIRNLQNLVKELQDQIIELEHENAMLRTSRVI